MSSMFNLLAVLPTWVSASFPIIRIVLVCIMALCAIAMTVTILMQSNSNDDATSALTGHVQESYYALNSTTPAKQTLVRV